MGDRLAWRFVHKKANPLNSNLSVLGNLNHGGAHHGESHVSDIELLGAPCLDVCVDEELH